MTIDKELLKGSTTMFILKLLDSGDMYGYQMTKELEKSFWLERKKNGPQFIGNANVYIRDRGGYCQNHK